MPAANNREPEDDVIRHRSNIYIVLTIFALFLVGLSSKQGYQIAIFFWAFPAGIIHCFDRSADFTTALVAGYIVYAAVGLCIGAAKKVSWVVAFLVLHALVLLLTIRGCATLGNAL